MVSDSDLFRANTSGALLSASQYGGLVLAFEPHRFHAVLDRFDDGRICSIVKFLLDVLARDVLGEFVSACSPTGRAR